MQSTTTSHTRKPQTTRTLSVLKQPTLGLGCQLEITMTRGKNAETFHYQVDELTTDFGRGFRFTKIGEDEAIYVVLVDTDTVSCECLGYLKWSRCKHSGAALKLIGLKIF